MHIFEKGVPEFSPEKIQNIYNQSLRDFAEELALSNDSPTINGPSEPSSGTRSRPLNSRPRWYLNWGEF